MVKARGLFGLRLLNRAARLQEQCDQQQALIEQQRETIDALEKHMNDRAFLVSIEVQGRTNRLMFIRDGKPVLIECYSTMSDNVPGWRKALLG